MDDDDRAVLEASHARMMRRRAEIGNRSDPGYQRIGNTSELADIVRMATERVVSDPDHDARVAEWNRAQRDRREHEIRARRETWLRERSGIPRELAKAMIGSSVDAHTVACGSAGLALAGGRRLVVLLGPPGTGKTWGACYALWARHLERDQAELDEVMPRARVGGQFVTAYRYCQMPTWEQAADNPYAETPVLVVDDLGREPSDRRGQVEELLIGRWEDGLLTIVTSNLSAEDLADSYDGRVADRMRDPLAGVIETDERLRGGG